MILRALRVESLAVLNPGLELDELGSRITLIHGRNEAGKSTLLRALTYALYQRHKVGGADVEADLLPAGTSLGPHVEVELEHDGTIWKIEKTFLKSKRARLSRWEGDRFVPAKDGDEADEELGRILDSAFGPRGKSRSDLRGIGEVLISDQGSLRDVHGLGERAKSSLRDVLGAVTSTREAKGLAAIVKARHELAFTKEGRVREATELRRTEARVEELDAALARAQEEAAAIRELELSLQEAAPDPIGLAAQRDGLEASREIAREENERRIRLQAIVDGARKERDSADRGLSSETLAQARVTELEAELGSLERSLEKTAAERARMELERERARAAVLQLEDERDRLDARSKEIEEERARAVDARRAAVLQASIAELLPRLEAHRLASEEARRHSAELAARARPSQEDFTALSKLRSRIAEMAAQLESLSLRVRVEASTALVVRAGDEEISLAAGEMYEVGGQSPFRAEIVGVARLEVLGPRSEEAAGIRTDLQELERELARRTDPFGTREELELERLFAERADLLQRREAARNRAEGSFASIDDHDDAIASSASMRRELDAILERRPEWNGETPAREIADERAAHVERLAALHEEHGTTCKRELRVARERSKAADGAKERADEGHSELSRNRIEKQAEWSARGGTTPAADREARLAALRRALSDREEALAGIERELAPLADAEASLRRAERAVSDFDAAIHARERKRAEDEGRLKRMRESGLYGQLAELAEEREELLAALEILRLEARALQVLHASFQEEERRAIEAVFAPVAEKVRRMALAVLRKDLRIDFDDGLGTPCVGLAGHEFTLDQLSHGTRDQIALFTRIAFAELYAEKHGRHALVLDDPLVNCDPERRARILDVLARAAQNLQILIFTCRPDDYLGLSCEKREIGS